MDLKKKLSSPPTKAGSVHHRVPADQGNNVGEKPIVIIFVTLLLCRYTKTEGKAYEEPE